MSNRDDIHQFFKDMPIEMQQEVINELNKQIKKPPDCNYKKLQEVVEHEESTA